jgi:serine/threonine protein kinase
MESNSEKYIDHYQIHQTLGRGASCKVKLALDTSNGNKKVAVKILNNDMGDDVKDLLFNEINSLDKIDHPNVIKYLKRGKSEYRKPSGSEEVRYISLEIAEKGELFDFVLNTGKFSEETARYFFKQIIGGLQSCHQA